MLLTLKSKQNLKKTCKINSKFQNSSFQEFNFDTEDFDACALPQDKTNNHIKEFQNKYESKQQVLLSKLCNSGSKNTLQESRFNKHITANLKQSSVKDKKTLLLQPILFQQFSVEDFKNSDLNRNIMGQKKELRTNESSNKNSYGMKNSKNDDEQTCSDTKNKFSIDSAKNASSIIFQDNFGSFHQKKENFINIKKYDILKDFKINEKIGEGAYGEVYSAINIHSNQIRAIKILKNKPSSSNSNSQNYLQEFNLLKKLDHPNILKLFEIYQNASKVHIVTELCTGKSLSSYLKAKFSFSKAVKQQILHQIFKAINYLDELNIIHRDLKPDNIIFTQEITEQTSAEDIQIKIIDFGLSLECAERKIKDWSHMGTKNYMSPETFNGIYSHKGDSWACGIIMHLLLLNSNPFLHVDTQEKQINKKSYKLNTKSQKWAKLQKSEQQLLQSLLHPNYVLRSDMKVALQSKFFQKKSQNLEEKNAIIQQLKRPCQTNGFIDFIESYLSFTKVSLQKRLDYSKIFYSINKSNSGQINLSELSAFLQLNNSEEETYIFKKINKSGKGLISFEELIASLSDKRQLLSMENLKDLFRSLDINKNNSLDKEELRYFIKSVTKEQLQKLYLVLSKSQKRINFERFQAYIQECMYSS